MGELQEPQYYYIREAAQLTGLSQQLIRKWENRYHIVHPQRLANGYRVYTFADLLTLKQLKALRDQGKSIKQAVQEVITEKKPDYSSQVEESPHVAKMIEKGTNYDEDGLMFLLQQANHQYGLARFLQHTIQPFLEKIGELWEKAAWDESQETVATLVVRDFLTQISRNFNNHLEAPHAIGFCLPNEYHEVPLQILLLQLKMKGWRTTRIGASPKFSAIETLIGRMQPQKVMLSATTVIPFQKDKHLMERLDRIAENYPHIDFYIGGKGVWHYTEIIKPKHMHVSFPIDDLTASHE